MTSRVVQFSEDRRRYLKPGFVLANKYEVVEHIASGAFGDVYEGKDRDLERPVAVKLMQQRYRRDDKARAKFLQEARALARIDHPNVVKVYDVGMLGDRIWFAMQFIEEGRTLRDELEDDEVFDVHRALSLAMAVLDALAAAHQTGVIHRDIKPENILLDGARPLVGDFGTARLLSHQGTDSQKVAGTAGYMAPEQAMPGAPMGAGLLRTPRLQRPDARSDVYAAGAVLYEMLSGRPAFIAAPGMTLAEVLSLHKAGPDPLERVAGWVPRDVRAIVRKAMQLEPKDRYQNAGDMLGDCAIADENLYTEEARQRRRALLQQNPNVARLLPDTDRDLLSGVPRNLVAGAARAPGRLRMTLRQIGMALLGAAFGAAVAFWVLPWTKSES
ncbi:MAG TPA: serine/threonine-protein kinase, partial [Polyangiaceae bacterium]